MSGAGSRGLTAARGCQCMPAVTAAVANAHDYIRYSYIPSTTSRYPHRRGHVHDEHTHGPATIVYPLSIFIGVSVSPCRHIFSHYSHMPRGTEAWTVVWFHGPSPSAPRLARLA